jgi:DNA-binding NtrC family response regulator
MLENILVVDGEVASRDTFYEVLSSMGYRVTCVSNGKEALLRIERDSPALVVVDSQITPMDCYEAMTKMKEFNSDMDFVLLTKADPSPLEKEKAMAAGALATLKKDFSTHHMLKEILTILKEQVRDVRKETRQGKILLIDDEAEIRNMLSSFLTMKGYNVATASSVEEGLMDIRTQKPQLVLCDIRMPGMDGLMVLKKILQIDPSIKVVMLTAIQDEEMIAEAFKEGAADYLFKPCSLKKLDALVSSILPF